MLYLFILSLYLIILEFCILELLLNYYLIILPYRTIELNSGISSFKTVNKNLYLFYYNHQNLIPYFIINLFIYVIIRNRYNFISL
jgi:hypothetical protein